MPAGSGLFSKMKAEKAHLNKPGSEIYDLRQDLVTSFSAMAAFGIDEFTDPAAAGAADLEVATATTVAPRTVTTFLAGGVAKLAAYPRNLTFTTAGTTPADAPATVTVTGKYLGKAQTETITLSQTAAAATGLKPFSSITSVAYAAADGTGATISIGVGAGLGLTKIPKSRAGLLTPIKEIAVGALVTNGTITATGLYTPNTAPNGTNDYAVYYEYDATLDVDT